MHINFKWFSFKNWKVATVRTCYSVAIWQLSSCLLLKWKFMFEIKQNHSPSVFLSRDLPILTIYLQQWKISQKTSTSDFCVCYLHIVLNSKWMKTNVKFETVLANDIGKLFLDFEWKYTHENTILRLCLIKVSVHS